MNAKSVAPGPVEAVPPLPPKWGWGVLLAGLGACALSAVLGVAIDLSALANQPPEMAERLKWASGQAGPQSQPGSVGELRRLHSQIGETASFSTLRIGLVAVGVLSGACGLWMRGGQRLAWFAAAAAAFLGGFGLPLHWDSLKLPLWVGGTLAAVAGGMTFLPLKWRYSLISLAVLVHFGGTLTATTWPDTQGRTAWVSNQVALRFYLPYFRFMYLSNAYHFYSPDPGPASKFFILIEYEIDDPEAPGGKRTTAEWVDIPRRREHYKDPLGLTYYRRLSITELASYSTPGTLLPATWERETVIERRVKNQLGTTASQVAVPDATVGSYQVDLNQYRQPQTGTRRSVYPSYARHIAAEYTRRRQTPDGRELMHTVTGMKMFRVEHRIIEAPQFLDYDNPEVLRYRERHPNPDRTIPANSEHISPYHPAMYSPYYLGEYSPTGELINPYDPLLYWYTPVKYNPAVGKGERTYTDWMSRYAGREFPWEGKE